MSTGVLAIKRESLFRGLLNRYFYFSMSLVIAAAVVYGFSHTVGRNLIHAVPVRPWILYLHGAVFSGWVAFFILQSALVRTRNVRVHRSLGWFGVAMGASMPVLGVATALIMARFFTLRFHSTSAAPFLAIQFWGMICFTTFFVLAIYWRKKPELHRRFILIASCVLTAAAFARFPQAPLLSHWLLHSPRRVAFAYFDADVLISLGILRDGIVMKRPHRIYLYALPLLIAGQILAVHLAYGSPEWAQITGKLVHFI